MAGVKIAVDLGGFIPAGEALSTLQQLLQKPDAIFKDIGEYLLLAHDDRFEQRKAPDGTPWAPVSEEYAKRKRAGQAGARRGGVRDPGAILELSRDLRRLNRYQIEGQELLFGTDRVYGASMHFGDPARGLVARPIYGVSSQDEGEIRTIYGNHILAVAQ